MCLFILDVCNVLSCHVMQGNIGSIQETTGAHVLECAGGLSVASEGVSETLIAALPP